MLSLILDGCQEYFLHSDLFEEVYMQSPPSLSHPPSTIYHLRPRAWFEWFWRVVHGTTFTESIYDDCALFTHWSSHVITLLLFCVKDMIVVGDHASTIGSLKKHL